MASVAENNLQGVSGGLAPDSGNPRIEHGLQATSIDGCSLPSRGHGADEGSLLLNAWEAISKAMGGHKEIDASLCFASRGRDQAVETLCRDADLRARRITLTGTWWKADSGPILAFRNGHAVALIPDARRRYRLFDPATGRTLRLTASLAAELEDQAYSVYRLFLAGPVTPFRLVAFWVRECRAELWHVALLGLFTGLLGLAVPLITARLVSFVIPFAEREEAPVLGAMLLGTSVAGALFAYANGITIQRAGFRTGSAALYALWDRLLTLPPAFLAKYSAGDLGQRAAAVDQIRELVAQPSTAAALTCPFALIQAVLLFLYRPDVAAVALLLPLTMMSCYVVGSILLARQHRARAAYQGALSSSVFQTISGIDKLRVAGAESRAYTRWNRLFLRSRTPALRVRRIGAMFTALEAIAPLLGWAIVVYGSGLGTRGETPANAGPLFAFSMAFQQIIAAAMQFGALLMSLAQIGPLVGRLRPLLDASPEMSTAMPDPGVLTGAIELENVRFEYQAGHAVLKGVSTRIRPGEFVAIVGASGCGKSTLLRLLLGFEQPVSGRVLYDGKETGAINLQALRRQIGVVLQNGRIFDGDIASNILGSSSGLGFDAAWEAARIAGLDAEIQAMPMKMHTLVTEGGGGLSGGQRQRLLIARAVVNRPRILLFDEATSALDNRTQALVTERIEELNITRVVIAHRPSTVRNADRILVLNDGVIAESGTYSELIQQKGIFYRMTGRR